MSRTTLLLSTRSLPAARALSDAAQRRGWSVATIPEVREERHANERLVYYGPTDAAARVPQLFDLYLIEPEVGTLAKLPRTLLLRTVEARRFNFLHHLTDAMFIRPMDPVDRSFEPGVYSSADQVRTIHPVTGQSDIYVAEPVEWVIEYRAFVTDGRIATVTPARSFGRPITQMRRNATPAAEIRTVSGIIEKMLRLRSIHWPAAFAVDVGLIDERGWAIADLLPAWYAEIYSADPARVLDVLARATIDSNADRVEQQEHREHRTPVKRERPRFGLPPREHREPREPRAASADDPGSSPPRFPEHDQSRYRDDDLDRYDDRYR